MGLWSEEGSVASDWAAENTAAIEASEKPGKDPIKYRIPDWFLTGRVRTAADSQDSKLTLLKSGSKHTKRLPSRVATATYEVQEDEYAELRDIIAATVLSDRAFPDRKLDHTQPTLKIKTESFMYITALLEHLARDIGATLISADAEDLYDLACDFNEQERQTVAEAKGNLEAPRRPEASQPKYWDENSMVEFYFGARCNKDTASNPSKRAHNAIQAILDAPRTKRAYTGSAETCDSVILHLRDTHGIAAKEHENKILKRFRSGVQNCRQNNQAIVMVASYWNEVDDWAFPRCDKLMGHEPLFEFNFEVPVPSISATASARKKKSNSS
ncbi:hypothetical protein BO78DRAFT_428786 [Aspergillus sclerotiicarbonarius CBS 121057]|uniref:Uncharacterized protein n=1 Tax=Aspergillus sclerotiicarbonarius (strain CBS 121057 / IBT 28362) TaxID=1448318 RepID=A0A319EDR5_ASPSB|nr:hypothetical protein BO78DRAFT_428786 [Aspergillus sclerotiicarbonarius CBS 121057]